MAALRTPDPRLDAPAPGGGLRLLRELGAQAVPAWAALQSLPDGKTRLVVVERAQTKAFESDEIADWMRDAKRLSALDHPNVARVRDVVIRTNDILVVSDFVDGVRWTEFAAASSLELALRVFVDALTGLSALHNMRDLQDPRRPSFKLVHSGLTPDCIIVGLDGMARVVGASRPRSATARLADTASAYLAPEVLLEDDSTDVRADVYSVGVMLWEALSARRFLPNLQPSAIVTQLLSGRVPPVTLPEASPWAAPLGDVVMRALSADPEKRFPSALAMAAELRRIGSAKIPSTMRVATSVRAACGTKATTRRQELERGEVRPSDVLRGKPPEEISVDLTDEVGATPEPEASQTAPTVPPPGLPGEIVPAQPAALAPPPVLADIATPLAPEPISPPPALEAIAPPLVPVPGPPVEPASPSPPPLRSPPLTLDRERGAITTASPFALETPPVVERFQVGGTPSKRTRLGVAIVAAALVLGGVLWWLAPHGSRTGAQSAGTPIGSPTQPASIATDPTTATGPAPAETQADPTTSPHPMVGGSASTLAPTPATAPESAPATAPESAPPTATASATAPESATASATGPTPASAPGSVPTPESATAPTLATPHALAHSPEPASLRPPVAPKRAAIHRGYDPQGI